MNTELYIGTCEADLNGKVDFEYFKGTISSKTESVIFKGETYMEGKLNWVLIYVRKEVEKIYKGILNVK